MQPLGSCQPAFLARALLQGATHIGIESRAASVPLAGRGCTGGAPGECLAGLPARRKWASAPISSFQNAQMQPRGLNNHKPLHPLFVIVWAVPQHRPLFFLQLPPEPPSTSHPQASCNHRVPFLHRRSCAGFLGTSRTYCPYPHLHLHLHLHDNQ